MSLQPDDWVYLSWLYKQVIPRRLRAPRKTFHNLLGQLHEKEFVWFVANDDNRVEDGRDLRKEFVQETGYDVDPAWLDLGCSFLEMLIGLSRRLAFEMEGEPVEWFWELISNLQLSECNDLPNQFSRDDVDEIMDAVIWRTYAHDGRGGLFPLRYPTRDQREVEIWYQLNAYLLELP